MISGVDRLAATERAAGLIERLTDVVAGSVVDAGGVSVPGYDIEGWMPGGAPFNAEAILGFTIELADTVESLVSTRGPLGRYSTSVLVLGGDCSVLLGPLLALKRAGPPGLVFIDAHSDFRHEAVDALAGEELAVATGRGGHALTNLENRCPLLRDEDVVTIGIRDPQPEPLPFTQVSTAAEALEALTTDTVWVHVDADILDPSFLPAVDSPEPNGFTPDELVAVLQPLLADDRVRGMDLCIYDPALDSPGLPGATLLAEILGRSFDRVSST
ncbi:MAG: argI [Schumannella sp.]|nr:argI [Schumannella sp.]